MNDKFLPIDVRRRVARVKVADVAVKPRECTQVLNFPVRRRFVSGQLGQRRQPCCRHLWRRGYGRQAISRGCARRAGDSHKRHESEPQRQEEGRVSRGPWRRRAFGIAVCPGEVGGEEGVGHDEAKVLEKMAGAKQKRLRRCRKQAQSSFASPDRNNFSSNGGSSGDHCWPDPDGVEQNSAKRTGGPDF